MNKWLLLFLLGCASTKKPALPQGHDYAIKSLGPQGLIESRKFLTNRRNYLLALFEQSYDPYYGTPRWTSNCLLENQIGKILETSKGIFMVSRLYLNSTFELGFCSSMVHATGHYVVYYQCESDQYLTELRVPSGSFDEHFDWKNLCT